jgi:hypothetical protein
MNEKLLCPKDVNFYFLATSDGTITSLTIEGPGSGNCTIRQVKNYPLTILSSPVILIGKGR